MTGDASQLSVTLGLMFFELKPEMESRPQLSRPRTQSVGFEDPLGQGLGLEDSISGLINPTCFNLLWIVVQ